VNRREVMTAAGHSVFRGRRLLRGRGRAGQAVRQPLVVNCVRDGSHPEATGSAVRSYK